MEKYFQNAIMVKETGEILVSNTVHDFKAVELSGNRSVGVDGGVDYLRRIGNSEDYIELSLSNLSPLSSWVYRLVWGTLGVNGKGPLVYKRLIDLSTDHLKAILNTQSISSQYRTVINKIIEDRKEKS